MRFDLASGYAGYVRGSAEIRSVSRVWQTSNVNEFLGGVIFLAVMTWFISGIVLALLRRGRQITYIVPMTIEEERRLNEALRRISPTILLVAGAVVAVHNSVLLGAATVATGGAMLAWTLRPRRDVDPNK